MTVQLQDVTLSGGAFNRQIAKAPPPPLVLSLSIELDGEQWMETYAYDGHTKKGLPVMRYDGHVRKGSHPGGEQITTGDVPTQSPTRQGAGAFAARFPSLPHQEIAWILIEARRSVELFGLSREEEMQIAERIAVSVLKQRAVRSRSRSPRARAIAY